MLISPSELAAQVAGTYFDGQSAAPIAVTLAADGRELLLHWADCELRWPLDEVQISERLGSTPRLVFFPGGGHCEVVDHARFDKLLKELGLRKGWLDALQHSMGWAVAAVLLIALASAGGYRYLLPWSAERLSSQVPEVALQQMSDSTLKFLDRSILQPSKLGVERQQELALSFAKLEPGSVETPHYQILFRRSAAMGANAFALPDGTLVVLDGLVELAQDNNEINAVLAHELGHVQRRHGVRMLLQSSIVGLVLTWYVGDISTLLAGAPTLLLQAKYSRDMEREADEYAAQVLQRNGMSTCLLADMLSKLEISHQKKVAETAQKRHDTTKRNANNIAADYLASHPGTRERTKMICPGRE